MKKIILFLIPALCFGAAGDIKISYKAANNTTWIDAIFAKQNNSILGTDSNGVPRIATGGTFTDVLNINKATAVNPSAPPDTIMHLSSPDGTVNRVIQDSWGVAGVWTIRIANGTSASPTAVGSGTQMAVWSIFGYGATGYSASRRAAVRVNATETWTDSAQGTSIAFETTPNGSISTADAVLIGNDKSTTFYGEIVSSVLHASGSSNLVKTADTALADIPGLTINVVSGGKYNFRASVQLGATTTGGFRTVMAGTATLSDIRVQDTITQGASGGTAVVTTSVIGALNAGNNQASTGTNATGVSEFSGSFTVTTGGTIKIQAAQNNNAGVSTFYSESTIDAWRTQ